MSRVSGGRKTWRVLIADDNDDHALLIQMALERATDGHVVLRRARDGDEAVAMVAEEQPDLLLLDLHMPGRSGHEVLQHLKGSHEHRRIPVAVLTSSDRDEDIAESYGLGGNHFITKPVIRRCSTRSSARSSKPPGARSDQVAALVISRRRAPRPRVRRATS